jgi:hypothetical protein
MQRKLLFTETAAKQLAALKSNPSTAGLLKQVEKTIGLLETNPRAQSLQTHEFVSLTMRYKVKVFEAYVQQDTPGAYRVFWRYGDDLVDKKGKRIPAITVLLITAHPD